jgi:hypothetical protein
MADWIRETDDMETRAMDSMCLIECIWWGKGAEMYDRWYHGIYEFREFCWQLSLWTESGWEHLRDELQEEICFDTEFCPELIVHVLDEYADVESAYVPTKWTVARFVDEWIAARGGDVV